MAISKKPKRGEESAKTADPKKDEAQIMSFIEKGGSVPGEKKQGGQTRAFTLRVDESVLDRVDEVVAEHPVLRSRNTWIVNAIVEQLKRDRSSD
ncbi:MAG: hypothetical protein AAFR95_13050 [Bacteroidota bacterium]